MQIGITCDLRSEYLARGFSEEQTAEFDRDETVEIIEQTLHGLGHTTQRIGSITNLVACLAAGAVWDLVWNIAEGLNGYSREAQVPALLDAYSIPYTFSDPLVMSLTLHKGMAKRVLRDLGIPTPAFAEVQTIGNLEDISLPYPLFAKPISEGTSKGIDAGSLISCAEDLNSRCADLLKTYHQPVLVEEYLPGREFTAGIIGTGPQAACIGVAEIILNSSAEANVYSYANKEDCEKHIEYRLADDRIAQEAAVTALAAWRGLGCRDGGRVDLRQATDGTVHVIEINPLAGMHPTHSDLPIIASLAGIPYSRLLEAIITSAAERITGTI